MVNLNHVSNQGGFKMKKGQIPVVGCFNHDISFVYRHTEPGPSG